MPQAPLCLIGRQVQAPQLAKVLPIPPIRRKVLNQEALTPLLLVRQQQLLQQLLVAKMLFRRLMLPMATPLVAQWRCRPTVRLLQLARCTTM